MDAPDKEHVAALFTSTSERHQTLALFEQLGERLVEWADLAAGERVLDVAAGTGASLVPAARRVAPLGRVVGVDLAEGMAERLRAVIVRHGLANAEALVADAEALPFPDEDFDAVICGFALFFFPDAQCALAEFRRVLRPGGRLAISTFTRRGSASMDSIWRLLGQHIEVPAPAADARRFHDTHVLGDALTAAGFGAIQISESPYEVALEDFDAWWDWIRSMEFGEYIDRMDQSTYGEFRKAASRALAGRQEAPLVQFPMDALLTRARRQQ